MKKNKLILLLSSPLLALAVGVSFNKGDFYNSLEIKDKQSIILFEDGYSKSDFERDFNKISSYYEILDTYNGLNNGVLIRYDSDFDTQLKNFKGVRGVFENKLYKVTPSDIYVYDAEEVFTTPPENKSLKEMNVPSSHKGGENTVITVLDTSFSLEHNAFKDLGADVEVRIEESDVREFLNNYEKANDTSTSTSDCYYNNKVPYYHDYGGSITHLEEDYSNLDDNVQDNDVEYPADPHGMHVSSIAAANGDLFQGVAPNAQLMFMKVDVEVKNDPNSSYISDTAMLEALNDAYLLGTDVINVSIGNVNNELEEFAYEICKKFIERGVQVNFSQGNEGKRTWSNSGIYRYSTTDIVEDSTIGSMAISPYVTSVASSNLSDDSLNTSLVAVDGELIEVRDQIVDNVTSSGEITYKEQKPFHSLIPEGEESVTLEYVVVPNFGAEEDYASLYVKGKIAVVRRGTLSFGEKIVNAKNKGAVGIVIANAEGSGSQGIFQLDGVKESDLIPAVSSSVQSYDTFSNAENKVVTISKTMISSFSTVGTGANLTLKPDISAPGQNIIGAINGVNGKVSLDTYQYYSGTSMASPNLTGAESLILGEEEFASEEERVAFMKTIKNRVMSNTKVLFNANGAPISPRVQGAGVVNVANTIDSNMYLESDTTSYGAKVELKNNEDIQNGIIDFSVTLNNEDLKTGSYEATLYVTAPHVGFYDSEESQYYNHKVVSTDNDLLETHTFDVSLSGASQVIDVHYEISEEIKTYLNETFEYGSYIEGFLVLEATDSSLTDLSIPYMGFYQDFSEAPAVEPFDFEKEEGELYQSTLLNSLGRDTGLALSNTNFTSNIYVTEGGMNIQGIQGIIENTANPDGIYTPIGSTLEDGVYHLYAGTSSTDTLYIQQFVNRNVADNDVTLIDSSGNVVLEDHMFSALLGEDEENGTHPLYKSVARADYFNNGYIADRAYTIIPLKDRANDCYYEDGTYTLRFEYQLVEGSTQVKEYVLEIQSEDTVPYVSSFIYNEGIIEIVFAEKVSKVSIGGVKAEATDDTFTKYSLNVGELEKISIEIISTRGNTIYALTYKDSPYIMYGESLNDSLNFEITTGNESFSGVGNLNTYNIRIYSNNGMNASLNGRTNYYLGIKNSSEISDLYAAQVVNGVLQETEVTDVGAYKVILFNRDKIATNVAANASNDGTSDDYKTVLIITAAVMGVIIVGAIVAGIIVANKKKNKA